MQKPHGRTARQPRSALTLVEAVFVTLLCAALLVALQLFGFSMVTAALTAGLVFLLLTILWGLAYLRAPDLTTNGTVLLVLVLVTLSWVPGWMLENRESARRQTARNALRELGQAFHGVQDTGPRGNLEQRYREHERIRQAEEALR